MSGRDERCLLLRERSGPYWIEAYEAAAKVELKFTAEGFRCAFTMPLDAVEARSS